MAKKSSALKWLAIGAGALFILGVFKRNAIMQAVWDKVTDIRINNLHPAIRQRARQFINAAAAQGIMLRITDGLRTFAEQDELYAQGRTKPGAIVTNAKGGQSYHNYGLAIDVVEIKNGKGLWENPNWPKIAALGKSFGFAWGGDFKNLRDLPHLEYTGGLTIPQLLAKYNAGQLDNGGYISNIA
jgi:peptidoglycan L-alanyl-D-glutamate endopeptidase CwlK